MPKCRICGEEIKDKTTDISPFQGGHYHKACYDDWRENRNNLYVGPRPPMFWKESLKDYLWKELKMPVNWSKFESQWGNWTKSPGFTAKGIYFAVRYMYDIQHSSITKAQGGIGLVPEIYEESKKYWADIAYKQRVLPQQIKEQQEWRANRPVIKVRIRPEENNPKYKLSDY